MLFVDVEGEVSAASMVKDSKIYIEIAKFVQAYEAIVSDPNKFLVDIDEEPIDTETEVLTWDQFVTIATNCDLGFTPKPDEQTLAVYYSYAMQIGSISKETKRIATVEDIAQAQKKYYNFIDDTTAKVENQYKKQHEIASRRAREAAHVEKTISQKRLKLVGVFAGMAFGVFLCGLGLAGLFFDIGFVKFFGFGNRFIGGPILMVIGFLLFFFLDKHYLKFKRDFIVYKEESKSVISRSDRTSSDEMVLKDKLDKYKEDLKIAKYELADKNKTYDVSAAIEKLRAKNKYFQDMFDRDGFDKRLGLFGERGGLGLDDMPLKFKPGDNMDDFLKLGKKDPLLDMENMRGHQGHHGKGFINLGDGMFGPDSQFNPNAFGGQFPEGGRPGKFRRGNHGELGDDHRDRRDGRGGRGRHGDRDGREDMIRDEENRRLADEQRRLQEEQAKKVAEQNEKNGVKATAVPISSSHSHTQEGSTFKEEHTVYGGTGSQTGQGSSSGHGNVTSDYLIGKTNEVVSENKGRVDKAVHDMTELVENNGKKGKNPQKEDEYEGLGME